MKIGAKMSVGFGAVTLITAALGITAYVMFARVSNQVSLLSHQSLPAVQSSTGVERAAFEAILEEKNYLVQPSDEVHQRARKKVAELNSHLDRIDAIASEFADATLAAQSKDVRKITQQWSDLYDQGVAAIQATKTAEADLVRLGGLVGDEADAYATAKRAEYLQAKSALAIVNRLNDLLLQARQAEKSYMALREQRYLDSLYKATGDLFLALDDLDKAQPDASEQKQIADARKGAHDYESAARKWVATKKAAEEAAERMSTQSDALLSACRELTSAKERSYRNAVTEPAKSAAFSMLSLGHQALDDAANAAIHSKNYLQTGEQAEWQTASDSLEAVLKKLGELRPLATDEADRRSLDSSEKAAREYLADAQKWSDLDRQMELQSAEMDAGGEMVTSVADEYAAAKTARSDKVAAAVFIVSDISQTALQTRLSSRRYMMNQNQKDWQEVLDAIARLQKLYAELRKVSLTKDDFTRIDKAETATRQYLVAANIWMNSDRQVRQTILPNMNKIGDIVVATAQAAENRAWADSTDRDLQVTAIVTRSKVVSIFSLLFGIVVGGIIAVFITRSIVKPLKLGVEFSQRVAQGDLTQKIALQRNDEIGQLAATMNSMVDGLSSNMLSIAQNANSLSASSEELSAVSTQVRTNAEETASQANVVSAAAEQVSKNVGTVATGSEEMTASIREIAKNTSEAAKVASHAASVAEGTNTTVAKLGESSIEIGNVIKVITSIAEQTNLLALNATIEAARAGEAGKGFAVVANEVKELAKQTAKATEEIGSRILTIQTDARGAVDAIKEISGIIAQINQIQGVIASSVEEQSATTNEISKNVAEAARGASEIARNIASVSDAAKSTTAGASQTASAATELARLAAELKSIIEFFKIDQSSHTSRTNTDLRPPGSTKRPPEIVELDRGTSLVPTR